MARFSYEARDKQGRQIAGEVDAPNRIQATMQLRASDLWITKLEPAKILEIVLDEPPVRPFARAAGAPAAPGQWTYGLAPVRAGALRDFFDQLGELLEAGVTIHDAMTTLHGRVVPRLRPILREISPPLASGQSFSDQLARYPYVFEPGTVGLMRAGERSGRLGAMCRLIADQYQQDHRVWLSLLPVRAYGWLVIFFSIMISCVPTVLPAVFEWSTSHPEAGPMEVLHQMWSYYEPILVHSLLPLFLACVVVDWILRWVLRQPWGAGVRQDMLWVVPGASGYLRPLVYGKVLTVLEAMVQSGASFDTSLQAAAETAGPGRLGRELALAATRVHAGEPLGTAISGVTRLPFNARSALQTAEQAGAQERTLGRLAKGELDKLEGAPKRVAMTGYLWGLLIFGIITTIALAHALGAYSGLANVIDSWSK
jgi:type II secretory pathway component PulF